MTQTNQQNTWTRGANGRLTSTDDLFTVKPVSPLRTSTKSYSYPDLQPPSKALHQTSLLQSVDTSQELLPSLFQSLSIHSPIHTPLNSSAVSPLGSFGSRLPAEYTSPRALSPITSPAVQSRGVSPINCPLSTPKRSTAFISSHDNQSSAVDSLSYFNPPPLSTFPAHYNPHISTQSEERLIDISDNVGQNNSNSEVLLDDRESVFSETDSDNFSDDDMAVNSLMPEVFHGLQSEDAEGWLRDVQHWCAYRKLDDAGSLGVVPLLMKDGARNFYETLDPSHKDTMEHFIGAFREHFKRDAANSWKDVAAVWLTSQQPGQSVEAYISAVEQKARRANLEEEQLRFSILNGLRQEIRQQVLQHEPKTVAEIRKWATIAEASCDRAEICNPDMANMIRRLEAKMDRMSIHQIDAPKPQRSPSPRPSVHFEDNNRSSDFGRRGGGRSGPYAEGQWNAQYRNNQSGGQQGGYRGGSGQFQGNVQQQQYGGWSGQRQNSSQQLYSEENAYGRQGPQTESTCLNCGGFRHPMSRCPGRSVSCFKCGKMGHLARVCRSAHRPQQ